MQVDRGTDDVDSAVRRNAASGREAIPSQRVPAWTRHPAVARPAGGYARRAMETDDATPSRTGRVEEPLVEEELLVEEISIDGMCGVY